MTRGIPVALTGDIDDGLEDYDSCLRPLLDKLESYDIRMTFPVTASAISGNEAKISRLADHGHEIAGHGDVHRAFVGPVGIQVRRLREMLSTFRATLGIAPKGFRAPYLAHDRNLYSALPEVGIKYDSSRVAKDPIMYVRYSLVPGGPVYRDSKKNLFRAMKMYVSGLATPRPFQIAPRLLEIPVFEIDDWFLFEARNGPGLTPKDSEWAADLLTRALRHFSHGPNALVLQLHPKRVSPAFLPMLERFLEAATDSRHPFVTLQQLLPEETMHGD